MDEELAVEMPGIEERFYARVDNAWQNRLARAIPECRLVWNNNVEKYQVVYREPKHAQQLDGGHLRGWVIIGTFEPNDTIDGIINMLRKRQEFVAWKLGKMGYHGATPEEAIEAYLDDADRVLQEASDKLHDDVCDDYFLGPLARVRDENAIWKKTVERHLDETRRHTSRKKIIVAPGSILQ